MPSPVIDSGTTDTLIRRSDVPVNTPTEPYELAFTVASGDTIVSHERCTLRAPAAISTKAHILDDDQLARTLVSVSAYTNQGCTVTLTSTDATITKDEVIILKTTKHPEDKLWSLDAPALHQVPAIAALGQRNEIESDKVRWLHASLGSPPVPTFITALTQGYLRKHPSKVTSKMVKANPPHSLATAKGHLKRIRSGLRSTKQRPKTAQAYCNVGQATTELPLILEAVTVHPNQEPVDTLELPLDTVQVFTTLRYSDIHADLTGALPVPSHLDNMYILVFVMNNYIHVEPMKSRTGASYVAAYRRMVKFFSTKQVKPKHVRFDNETSGVLLDYLNNEAKLTHQKVPPHNHRANAAESAINNFKCHFISMLSGADPLCPFGLWDEFLPQAELTINSLRPFGPDPSISAHEGIFGEPYDFTAHPIGPIGHAVLCFAASSARTSWAPHGLEGFYVGPALDGYRTYRVWVKSTSSIRETDTIHWAADDYLLPGASFHELYLAAIQELHDRTRDLARSDHIQAHQRQAFDHHTNRIIEDLKELHSLFPPIGSPIPITTTVTPPNTSSPTLGAHNTPSVPVPHPIVSDQIVETPIVADPKRLRRQVERYGFSTQAIIAPNVDLVPARDRPLNLDHSGKPLTKRAAFSGPDFTKWIGGRSKELRKLLGVEEVMFPIHPSEQPPDRRGDTTYYNEQVKEKFDAREPDGIQRRVRGTVGGNLIHSELDLAAQVAELEVIKMLIHSVASDRAHNTDTQFVTLDITDYYLGAPLDRYEYVRIPVRDLPDDIMDEFNLHQYVHNGAVLFEIRKCIYGLPQAGAISQKRLVEQLNKHGYSSNPNVPCLFFNQAKTMFFTLVVDDFAVKAQIPGGVEHLVGVIEALGYHVKVDWTGRNGVYKYIGYDIKFNDKEQTVTLAMPDYVPKLIARFCPHEMPKFVASPEVYTPPIYGSTQPQQETVDDTTPLTTEELKHVQEIIGAAQYYARGIDYTAYTAANMAKSI